VRGLMAAAVGLALLGCNSGDETSEGSDTSLANELDYCASAGLTVRPWQDGGEGTKRHELAGDFETELMNGEIFKLSERWSGCENVVIVPHTIYFKAGDESSGSVWTGDIKELIKSSPENTIYLFQVIGGKDEVDEYAKPMQEAIDSFLANASDKRRAHWTSRLLVGKGLPKMTGEMAQILELGRARPGVAIDRFQNIRFLGSFAAVSAYDANNANWPWDPRLFSAAFESEYYNYESDRQDRLDAIDADEIVLVERSFREGFVDVEATIPSAAELAQYDTVELDITMECPSEDGEEFGNCGAWDYLAHMYIDDGADGWLEMGRFITTYHRESRWVVDASHAIPWMEQATDRTFRYVWQPSWASQDAILTIKLRLSNQDRGMRPVSTLPMFKGGNFNSSYNDRDPVTQAVPANTKKVEFIALTTGHGMDNGNCAEFCAHEHEFTIDGQVHLQSFPFVNSDTGCQDQISTMGTVPNQGGTWWLGRAGWCPGAKVIPWSVDVTESANVGGDLTASYRGLLNGTPPGDGHGNIVLESWLVLWE